MRQSKASRASGNGLHVSLNLPTGEVPAGLLLEASAVWNHSLLDEYGSIRARFADFSGNFTYHGRVAHRHGFAAHPAARPPACRTGRQ